MAEFLGNLYVFVDVPPKEKSAPSEKTSDDIFGTCWPGRLLWYQTGWAVSKNARGTYCARTSTSKLRTFTTFAEATDFVRKRRKAHTDERFHIVYEIDDCKSIVTSLEQIVRLDRDAAEVESSGVSDATMAPVFDRLAERVGKIVAGNALELLRILDREGEAAARARFSGATYERLWRVLNEAALVDCTQ